MSLLVQPAAFQGDRKPGSTLTFLFNSCDAAGTPTTLAGAPAAR